MTSGEKGRVGWGMKAFFIGNNIYASRQRTRYFFSSFFLGKVGDRWERGVGSDWTDESREVLVACLIDKVNGYLIYA